MGLVIFNRFFCCEIRIILSIRVGIFEFGLVMGLRLLTRKKGLALSCS